MSQYQHENVIGEQQNQDGLSPVIHQNEDHDDNFDQNQQQNQQDNQNYKQVLIKTSDLDPQAECNIISISNAAIEQVADLTNVFETQKFSKIAGIIKRQIDQKYGDGWYVIVGKNFGTYVTHERGSFMHYTFEDLHICVFRAR